MAAGAEVVVRGMRIVHGATLECERPWCLPADFRLVALSRSIYDKPIIPDDMRFISPTRPVVKREEARATFAHVCASWLEPKMHNHLNY